MRFVFFYADHRDHVLERVEMSDCDTPEQAINTRYGSALPTTPIECMHEGDYDLTYDSKNSPPPAPEPEFTASPLAASTIEAQAKLDALAELELIAPADPVATPPV